MSKDIGTKRVLTVLADTISGFSETVGHGAGGADLATGPGTEATLAAPAGAGASDPDLSDPDPDGRYREIALLGRGGLGEVMEVHDRDLRRDVALKRPRADRVGAGHVAALVEEAQIQGQLEHPNIPSVHALGIDEEGRPFFTMTRLRGQTLSDLLRERQRDPEVRSRVSTGRLLRIFLQIGSAIAFAHERGVVHRDLKPENVIIGAFGEVRVMDWGIAKQVEPAASAESSGPGRSVAVSTSVTRPAQARGQAAGTPGYAAPEQMRGDSDTDTRADVYGLGALLYEMLSGRPPIVGESIVAIIDATLAGEIVPVRKLVPVSDRLAAIVHRALATERADRYPEVLEMLHDVEAVLEGRPVAALREGALKRFGRFYMSQSPRYARFRTFDIDMLAWACYATGVTTGIGLYLMGTPHLKPIGVVALVLGLIAGAVPAYTAFRKARPDDPGEVIPFGEGLTTSYVSQRSAPSGDEIADTVAAEEQQS